MSCETTFNTYQQCNPVKKCGSVTAKRAYLFQTKELIRQALNAKGLDVTTDDTFRSYAEYIMQLPSLNNVVTAIIDYEGEKHIGDVTINKAFIGLDKVNNTTDLEKPISNATQAALDLKANNDATSIVTENWRAQLRINNVDNTSDTDKPVSTAVQTALDKKADKTDTLAGYGITDAKIEEGVITLGENTITPLTSTSLINGANVTGVVPEARKATRDSEDNIINETYAKSADVNSSLSKKQNKEDNTLETKSKTIVGAINEVRDSVAVQEGEISSLKAADTVIFDTLEGKADKATTLAGYNIGDAYTKDEVNAELDKKQDKLYGYTEKTEVIGGGVNCNEITIKATNGEGNLAIKTDRVIIGTKGGSVGITEINGALEGDAISKSIPDSGAVDTKTPSEKAVADALSQKADATSLSNYQTKAIDITGLDAKTVEGALEDLNNTSKTLSSEISDIKNTDLPAKANKATTLAGYNIGDAYTKTEVNTELGKKQDSLHTYTETESTGEHGSTSWSTVKIFAEGGENNAGKITLEANPGGGISGTGSIKLTAGGGLITLDSGGGGEIKLEGNIIGSAISTSIPDSASASDTKIPNERAISTALEDKANKATTLSGYGITDAKIDSGIITLGANTIEPLTPTSSIPANLISGSVDSADKATNDADGNVISTTYAKSADVNASLDLKQNITDYTLATTAKTVPAAINEVNSALSSKQDVSNLVTAFSATPNDTKYPSEKLVYSSLGTLSQSITSLENDTQALSNNKANKATTLAGYNIGDAYTKDVVDTKLNLKQDKTDETLTTTSKTIVGGINELVANKQNNLTTYTESETSATLTSDSIILNGALSGSGISATVSGNADSDKSKIPTVAAVYDSIQSLKVTSTVNTTVTPEAIEAATAITNALAKSARVVVNPNIANTGAVYIQESDTYTPINPIYPDPTNNVYEFVNMQNVKVFIDSLGDSVDLRIEYRG